MMTTDPANAAPVKAGDILDGKYQIERILGLGGMGVVVAARHLQLEQRVAIKFVLPGALFNAEAMQRFAREARAAVRLRSEHVARVLDVGTMQQGMPYMVMEYLEGRDLGDMIENHGPLRPTDAADFVLQACEAVAEAHASGIIHRDLKPRNLFVTHAVDGKPLVKVLDFGISKQTAMGSSGGDLSLTSTTTVMGSPNYMSPEQLRSAKTVDARTDIWAIGVIIYESLTGAVPFVAETVTQLTAMVLQDPPRPLEELRKDLPPGLSRVVARCLEKDPARRYGSVAELAQELEPFGSKRGVATRIAQVSASKLGGAPAALSSGRPAVTGGTSVAWGDTELVPPPRRRMMLILGGALGVIVLVAAGFGIGIHAQRASGTTPPLEVTPTSRQIEVAAPPPSSVPTPAPPPLASVAAPAPPAPRVSAAPSAQASVALPAAPRPPQERTSPAPRPRAAKPPVPPRPTDDLPSDRN